MKGLDDPQFKMYFNRILDLDWQDYELWAVGGIVSGWKTHDIDCIILGPYDEGRLANLMLDMYELGPWQPYWTDDPNPFVDRNERRRKIRALIPSLQYENKLIELSLKLPTLKMSVRKSIGTMYGLPELLIQNGSQVYF